MNITYKRIQRKIVYARYGGYHYIIGLKRKSLMIKYIFTSLIVFNNRKFIIAIVTYFICYILITYLMNVTYEQYNSPEMKQINYHLLEIVLIYAYIFIFIPNDALNNGQLNNEIQMKMYSNIYIVKLKKDKISDLNHTNSKINIINPVIVINPGYYFNSNPEKKEIECLLIGFVSHCN